MRYNLVRASVLFAVGTGLGLCLGDILPDLFPWIAGVVLVTAAFFGRGTRWCRIALLVTIFVLGAVLSMRNAPFPTWLLLRAQGLQEVTGMVVSYPSLGEDYLTFTFRPDTLPADLRVTWFANAGADAAAHYGDRLTLEGPVRLPEPFDGFDYPAYLARRGIFASMTVDEGGGRLHPDVGGSPILRLGDRVRQSILRLLRETLGADAVGLAQGLLFGDRAALDEDVEDAFRRTGLMHVLAVSGLHLGIVLAGVWFMLRRARLRPLVAYPVVGVLVLLVLWIVGPRVSLIRASLLFAFLCLGSVLADLGLILRRSIDPLNGLAAAAVVILALRPTQLLDVGFQLSFAATAGILIVVSSGFRSRWEPWVERVSGRWRAPGRIVRIVLTSIVISAAAQAAVAPVVAWHFGTFHPLLIGFNLIVVPLVTLALWLGLPGILLLGLGAPSFVVAPFGWALRALSASVGVLARLPLAELSVPRWLGLWLGAMVGYVLVVATMVEFGASTSDGVQRKKRQT